MLPSFQYVFFHQLTFSEKWDLHPWDNDRFSEELKNSIIQTGIIHPPYLLPQADKSFEVISGRKRLIIAERYCSSEKPGCFILPEDFPAESILDLLLEDQSGTSFSLAEKARFIEIAARYMTKEEIVKKFAARLEIRGHTSAINEMLKLLTLDIAIIKEIHHGSLQPKMIRELLQIKNPEDRLTLVELFRDFSLGGGKQKKLFSLIRDLAYRNHTSISEFLKGNEFQLILNHKEMNTPQKIQHLGNVLQEKLTPTYLESENNFAGFTKELALPKGFSLSHSQAFETDEVTLSIVFENSRECQQLLPKIKSVFKR